MTGPLPSVPAPANTTIPTVPLAEEIAEGIELCRFVARMRTKNRVLVDALTAAELDEHALVRWTRFAKEELHRMGVQACDEGRRAGQLRDATAGVPGAARDPHDYRHLDAHRLDRRARVGRAVGRALRQESRSASRRSAFLVDAALAAADEIDTAGSVLELQDSAFVVERATTVRTVLRLPSPGQVGL